MRFSLTLSAPFPSDIKVDYIAQGDTATGDEDFTVFGRDNRGRIHLHLDLGAGPG